MHFAWITWLAKKKEMADSNRADFAGVKGVTEIGWSARTVAGLLLRVTQWQGCLVKPLWRRAFNLPTPLSE
jgi:hypothetical protein